MDEETIQVTLKWVREAKKELIEKAFVIYEHLNRLEAMLND